MFFFIIFFLLVDMFVWINILERFCKDRNNILNMFLFLIGFDVKKYLCDFL